MKKRILSLFLAVCLVFMTLPASVMASTDSAVIYAVADKDVVVPGDTLTVTLKADNLTVDGSSSAKGLQFRFDYDSTKLEFTDKSYGELLRDAHTKNVSTKTDGQVGILASYTEAISKSGDIVVLTFTVKDSASGEFLFELLNPAGAISLTFGSVPSVSVEGSSVPAITVSADKSSAQRDEEITYSFDISKVTDFNGVQFDFDYDETKLEYVSKVEGEVFDNSDAGGINDADGMVTVLVVYNDSIEFEGNICTVTFRVKAAASNGAIENTVKNIKSEADIADTAVVDDVEIYGENTSAKLSITADKTEVTRGEEITFSFDLSETADFDGIQFDFDYDETRLEVVGYTEGSIFDDKFSGGINDADGIVSVIVAYADADVVEGNLCTVTFKALEDAPAGNALISLLDLKSTCSITADETEFSVKLKSQAVLSVSADRAGVTRGSQVTYSFDMTKVADFSGIQFDFDYDESKLEYVSVDNGTVLENAYVGDVEKTEVGGNELVKAVVAYDNDSVVEGNIFTITFNVKETAETGNIVNAVNDLKSYTDFSVSYPVEAYVPDKSVISVVADKTRANTGDLVTYTVNLAETLMYKGIEFDFDYDETRLEYVSYTKGDVFDDAFNGGIEKIADDENEWIKVLAVNSAAADFDGGSICTLTFKVKSAEDGAAYGPANVSFATMKPAGFEVAENFENAVVNVGSLLDVTTDRSSISSGEEVIYSVDISPACNFNGMEFVFEYDPQVFDFTEYTLGEAFDGSIAGGMENVDPGKVKLVLLKDGVFEGNICKIKLSVKDNVMYGVVNNTISGVKAPCVLGIGNVSNTLEIVPSEADIAAANNVISLIDAIGDVTIDSGDVIVAAENAYASLSEPQKTLVTNKDNLVVARVEYDVIVADHEAANAVKALIDAIGTVTSESEAAIEAAEAAFANLTDAQKVLVTNIATLTTARATYEDIVAANAVKALIDAIGTVTADSEAAIVAAEAAYANLTDAQKALVTNIATLTTARATYEDIVAANAVKALIEALGTVTSESEAAIVAAEAAYANLTDAQKALVTNSAVLTTARATYEDIVAANAVKALIEALGTVTLESADAIVAAEAAYANLTDAQKALVTNSAALTAARATYDEQKAAVDATIALINAIAEPITKDSITAIKAAEDAFNALSEIQKNHVTNKDALVQKRAAYDAIKTVKFDLNYSDADVTVKYIKAGQKIKEPEDPERSGYTFKGWFLDKDFDKEWDFKDDVVEKDITLYAKWNKKSSGGGGGSSSSSGKGSGGISVIVPSGPTTPVISDKEEGKNTFTDMNNHWASESVNKLFEVGIVQGESATTFNPDREITRAEFSAMIYRLVKPADLTENEFTDVNEGDWYNVAISSLAKLEFLKGYGDGTFRPNNLISRQEMAVIASRLYEHFNISAPVLAGLDVFADKADIAGWAADAVNKLASAKIINGYEDKTFRPLNNTSRAHAAKVIESIMNLK